MIGGAYMLLDQISSMDEGNNSSEDNGILKKLDDGFKAVVGAIRELDKLSSLSKKEDKSPPVFF